MMANRDFFTTPTQGNSRDAHDYGRTHLLVERSRRTADTWKACAILVSLGLWVAIGCALERLLTAAGY